MKRFIALLLFLLLTTIVSAETTFYDNPNDYSIYSNPPVTNPAGGEMHCPIPTIVQPEGNCTWIINNCQWQCSKINLESIVQTPQINEVTEQYILDEKIIFSGILFAIIIVVALIEYKKHKEGITVDDNHQSS